MTRDQFITTLKQRLYNNTDPDLDAIILSEMDFCQQNYLEGAEFWPWFLLTETNTAFTSALERRVLLPSDFLAEWEDGTLWRYDENSSDDKWIELKKTDFDAGLARYPGDDAPVRYALDSSYFYLFPRPNDVYTLKMKYYRKDTLPSALALGTDTNLWLTHASDWLMGEVGTIVATFHLGIPALEKPFQQQVARGRNRLLTLNIAREEQNSHRTLGED